MKCCEKLWKSGSKHFSMSSISKVLHRWYSTHCHMTRQSSKHWHIDWYRDESLLQTVCAGSDAFTQVWGQQWSILSGVASFFLQWSFTDGLAALDEMSAGCLLTCVSVWRLTELRVKHTVWIISPFNPAPWLLLIFDPHTHRRVMCNPVYWCV